MTLTPAQINNLKVSQLRAELQNRGLPINGLKAELVRRLTESCFEELARCGTGGTNKEGLLTRMTTSVESSLEEYMCSICHELPVDPVMAMDGQIYERTEIERWIQSKKNGDVTSPFTNEKMDKTLIPAQRVYNAIHKLIEDNDIDTVLAKSWLQRIKQLEVDKEEVTTLRANAKAGIPSEMYRLGVYYQQGSKIVPKDEEKAIEWYKKASDAQNPYGMSAYGYNLVIGFSSTSGSLTKNIGLGLMLLGRAASEGSDHACYQLGRCYLYGLYSFPKDKEQAKYYLKKAADGSCKHKHLGSDSIDLLKKWLSDIEAEAAANVPLPDL